MLQRWRKVYASRGEIVAIECIEAAGIEFLNLTSCSRAASPIGSRSRSEQNIANFVNGRSSFMGRNRRNFPSDRTRRSRLVSWPNPVGRRDYVDAESTNEAGTSGHCIAVIFGYRCVSADERVRTANQQQGEYPGY